MCRTELIPIDEKEKKSICYINDPYQENLDYNKKEILEQIDLHNILNDDVELVKKYIGKTAIIGSVNKKTVMIYFMPFYNKNWFQIIDINGENKYLLFTLIDDLKNNNYDVWYNSKMIYESIKIILDTIEV